jgi:hypothetical protein
MDVTSEPPTRAFAFGYLVPISEEAVNHFDLSYERSNLAKRGADQQSIDIMVRGRDILH